MEETVKDVGEFGLIDRIAKDLIYRPELVVIGSGDDGAVYRVPADYDQVISTDTMVEGIHFIKKTMRPSDVGYKLCASNFSDMAAMGADAIGFVISAALPEQLPVTRPPDLPRCLQGFRKSIPLYVSATSGRVRRSSSAAHSEQPERHL